MRLLKSAILTIAAVLALLTIGFVAVVYIFVAPVFGLRDRIPFDEGASTAVCAQVFSGALKPDADGVIKLAAADAGLSLYGETYSTTDSSGTVWVLFRTWQGKGSNLHGYLYRSTPAVGPAPKTIRALVPDIPPGAPTRLVDVVVDKQLGPNWFYVVVDLD